MRRGGVCQTGALLERLSDADRADLLEALRNPVITSTVIAKTLRSLEHVVSYDSVQRHRRKACACG